MQPIIDNKQIPAVTFKTRVKIGENFEWKDLTTSEIFDGKKVIVLALPGAFTPTCSSTHLPGFEVNFDEFKALGIDAIYCLSVNDTFVMNAWSKDQNLTNIKMLPDGNAELTEKLGMLVDKSNIGFGKRSWRYSMYVENGTIQKSFIEDGFSDNMESDPFEVSDAQTMLEYLQSLE
jgi:thioredoxin-dependent peroxiredoxin